MHSKLMNIQCRTSFNKFTPILSKVCFHAAFPVDSGFFMFILLSILLAPAQTFVATHLNVKALDKIAMIYVLYLQLKIFCEDFTPFW